MACHSADCRQCFGYGRRLCVPGIFGPKADFQMQPNFSSNRTLIYPNQASFKIAVSSVNGFSGVVTLTSNASANMNAMIVTATPGVPVILLGTSDTADKTQYLDYLKASITVQPAVAGNYTIIVTGTSGKLSHSVAFSLVIQDIGFSASPGTLVCGANYTANSTITMTSRNGLSGTLNLGGDWHLNTVTPSPASVYLPEGGSAQAKVTVTCGRLYPPPGNCITFDATIQMVGALD